MQISCFIPNLKVKKSMIQLDNNKVKSEMEKLEEELEGMCNDQGRVEKQPEGVL